MASSYSYNGTGEDIFAKFDMQDLEVIGYYYHATGLGTTALFDGGRVWRLGHTRTSSGYLGQITYKFGPVKLGYNHGDSILDYAKDAAGSGSQPEHGLEATARTPSGCTTR